MSAGSPTATSHDDKLTWWEKLGLGVVFTVLLVFGIYLGMTYGDFQVVGYIMWIILGPGMMMAGYYLTRIANANAGVVSGKETWSMALLVVGTIFAFAPFPRFMKQVRAKTPVMFGELVNENPPLVTVLPNDNNTEKIRIARLGQDEYGEQTLAKDQEYVLQILVSVKEKVNEDGNIPEKEVVVAKGSRGRVWYEVKGVPSRADAF